ncbi:hypothetical protein RRG08_036227 [Elysia crispata]|uniref:Uncharacterized protein n=1 Tax=Elysia crispata TaxID=231223 RepID=A0AAE1CF08_9GAST|nr:hypothetical protein RRG08_036227 [Elysia crispata]
MNYNNDSPLKLRSIACSLDQKRAPGNGNVLMNGTRVVELRQQIEAFTGRSITWYERTILIGSHSTKTERQFRGLMVELIEAICLTGIYRS